MIGRPTSAGAPWTRYAPMLSKAFVDEDFEFSRKYMAGQKEMEPRWKRCVRSTDRNLGMALGRTLR